MLAYYGSRISDHMTETPEGFLICHNVPINRTGEQQYLLREIGLEGDGLVTVIRTEDEVFSREALASFEGKPVTQDHPPGSVKPFNYGMYTKGHAQNVHRGTGSESDCSIEKVFNYLDGGLTDEAMSLTARLKLAAEYNADYEELKQQREESKELFRIKAQIDSVLKEQERIQEQRARQQKKDEMNRD